MSCWLLPAGIVKLTSFAVMEANGRPHVVKNAPSAPRNNIPKVNPPFFMKTAPGKAAHLRLPDANFSRSTINVEQPQKKY